MDTIEHVFSDNDEDEEGESGAAPKLVLTLKDKPEVGKKRKKTHANYFDWTDECLYKLAKLVKKHDAHVKNKYPFEFKFGLVMQDLLKDAKFDKLEIGWQGLKDRFKTEMDKVVASARDDTNLSAKRNEPTAYENLVLALAEDIDRKKQAAVRKQKSQLIHDKTMSSLEHAEKKKRQAVVPSDYSLLSPEAREFFTERDKAKSGERQSGGTEEETNVEDSGGKKSGSHVSDVSLATTKPEAVQYMDKVLSAISGLKDGGEDEEERELRKELLRVQIAAAKKAAGL